MIELFPSREVALAIGPLTVHWYGVMYIVAAVLVWHISFRLQRYRELSLSKSDWLELTTWGFGGALIGGRLGYVLFYEPSVFLEHFFTIFQVTDGGMSAHGGFIGVGIALWIAARMHRLSYFAVLDVMLVPAALGLAVGRIGNFINQELFVSGTSNLLVIGKDILLATALYALLRRWERGVPGVVTGVFLVGYAVLRFVSEYWRVQLFAGALGLTRGQLLSLPVLLVGVLLLVWVYKQQPDSSLNSVSKSDTRS